MFSSINLTIVEQSSSQSIRKDKLLGHHIRIHVVFELNSLSAGNLLNFIEIQTVQIIACTSEIKP